MKGIVHTINSSRDSVQSTSATSPGNDSMNRPGAAAACAKAQRRQCVQSKVEQLATIEKTIREYDDRLVKCCRQVAYLADQGAGWLAIDSEIGFMDVLQAHRRGVLSEYSRAGGAVKNLYNFGAHVEGETNA